MKRQKWVDHKFSVGTDPGWAFNIISRLEDVTIRLNGLLQNLDYEVLSKRLNDNWSIKEHLGHLIDLESLWANRFLQFKTFVPELVHADMSNQKTEQADHNKNTIEQLLAKFELERTELIKVYQSLETKVLMHQALHPRIKLLMRPVDLLSFVAEHDDHHICSIKQIINIEV